MLCCTEDGGAAATGVVLADEVTALGGAGVGSGCLSSACLVFHLLILGAALRLTMRSAPFFFSAMEKGSSAKALGKQGYGRLTQKRRSDEASSCSRARSDGRRLNSRTRLSFGRRLALLLRRASENRCCR